MNASLQSRASELSFATREEVHLPISAMQQLVLYYYCSCKPGQSQRTYALSRGPNFRRLVVDPEILVSLHVLWKRRAGTAMSGTSKAISIYYE
jgi:hypothetical protein